jgi:hypothetical protein
MGGFHHLCWIEDEELDKMARVLRSPTELFLSLSMGIQSVPLAQDLTTHLHLATALSTGVCH